MFFIGSTLAGTRGFTGIGAGQGESRQNRAQQTARIFKSALSYDPTSTFMNKQL